MNHSRILVVNADGYGFTPGVNTGIVETFAAGVVRSTSCTPNFGHLDDASKVQADYPAVSFGIHFNLSVGPPCAPASKVSSLLNDDGLFMGPALQAALIRGRIKKQHVDAELSAQAAMLADQGIKISHWDGHQNKHLWPVFFEVGSRVAKRFNIGAVRSHRRQLYSNAGPLGLAQLSKYYLKHPQRALTHAGGRLRTSQARHSGFASADRLITPGYVDSSHKSLSSFWYGLGESIARGTSEVYCHPGYPDALLQENATYVEERAQEVSVLTNPELLKHLQRSGVRLANFWDLQENRVR